jgi:hypothetical protein
MSEVAIQEWSESSAREVSLLKHVDRLLPLRVISCRDRRRRPCPFYSRKLPRPLPIGAAALGQNRTHALQQKLDEATGAVVLRGALNTAVDFSAERPEVDGLCQQRLSAALQCLPLGLSIAIGRDHDDRHIRPNGFRLRE